MKKIVGLCLSVLCIYLLTGCANTTIYPEADDSYSLVSTSREQYYAEKEALKKATDHCDNLHKKLTVLHHETAYHGPDKTNAALIGLAAAVLTGGSNPATSSNDYEVTMQFKCHA